MYKRILIATDGSRLSRRAIKHGIALAKSVGAAVVGFHARPFYPPLPADTAKLSDKQSIKIAEQNLAEIETAARKAGVSYKGVQARGASPSGSIIKTAKKEKCDLIVMASHGRKGMLRLLLGSETTQVLTHSHIPVLVTR